MWICGLEKASLGEGRGDVKGDAVEEMARVKPGLPIPKPGGGLISRGEWLTGVGARLTCHGAGEGRRMTV
jgi:hypothetical protein